MPDPQSSDCDPSHTSNDVIAPSVISSPKLWILFINHLVDVDLSKISLISIYFLFVMVFDHDFIIYIDFTGIAASNTATDDVKYKVTHEIFSTNL